MDLSLDEIKNTYAQIVVALKQWKFGNKAQLAFLEDLYTLVNEGIPANRAIDMIAQVTTGLNREVALVISQKIAQGQPLADGMRDWFAVNVIEIIRIGEAGGALAQTMKSAINMLSQRGVALGSFVTAMAYPFFVLMIACAMIIYLNTSVFVQFRTIKPLEEWPIAGQRLVGLANFLESWWWLMVLILIGIIIILRRLMINYVGELRPLMDKFPPFSFYKRFLAARMLETLGLLVSNGVVFKSAVKVMQHQANPYYHSHLIVMERLLSVGKTNIADVLDTGLVTEQDLMRLRVMAEVKGFEQGLIRMGIRGAEQATATLKFISRIIGGTFLTLDALLIIMIVQGIYATGMAMGAV
ncbi:MAG: hypothetical protein A3F11_08585 [Gammaproteobacteria bacterium RIFCSPHIGHO2_12_FULL_37_14]|nr:MAG: hypothetical protein A3F11_08585 [Gammaproteobacteria bacterium RIFCSPHIGHO2_12_FULL_37_14]